MEQMMFFTDPVLVLQDSVQNNITEDDINLLIPSDFEGKDLFVRFYLTHNGGMFPWRTETLFYKDVNYSEGRRKIFSIESFYFIAKNGDTEEKSPRLLSINMCWKILKRRPDVVRFADTHIPFAADGSGNNFWLDIENGHIKSTLWDVGIGADNPLDIAPSFLDFCRGISQRK